MLQALAQLAGKMATRPPQGTKGAKLVSFQREELRDEVRTGRGLKRDDGATVMWRKPRPRRSGVEKLYAQALSKKTNLHVSGICR
jgi:hypothetical protein